MVAMSPSLLGWLVLICIGPIYTANAALECDSDQYCQSIFSGYTGRTYQGLEEPVLSFCLPSGTCSNPFHGGCLRLLGTTNEQRSSFRPCNSDDRYLRFHPNLWNENVGNTNNNISATASTKSLTLYDCNARPPDFDYPEFRVANGNWESSLFLSWIYQIILSEMLGVPTTVGLNSGMTTSRTSFYSLENLMEYPSVAYPYWALVESNKLDDSECFNTLEDCANLLPEIWDSQTEFAEHVRNGTMDPPVANGQIAKLSFYIPAFTAQQYPSLAIFYGYQGEANRKFLANTFKRPTTWQVYCQEVSNTSCSTPDGTAERAPAANSTEGEMYFKKGEYSGYFRATHKNDCSGGNATACTGHCVAPPCGWNIFPEAQLYWNDVVAMEVGDGPLEPHGGYGYNSMVEIWNAANATKSHVMVGWYQPERLVAEFFHTDTAFQEVLFPPPTDVCLDHRPSSADRCSEDVAKRRGDPRGSCDNQMQALLQLVANSVGKNNKKLRDALQSPSYDFVKSIRISDLEINRMFQKWLASKNVDPFGNDARMAVCSWVVENYDNLKWFLPVGFPRRLSSQNSYEEWYVVLAQLYGILTGFVAFIGMTLAWRHRDTKVMVFAQPLFIFLILTGFAANCFGAVLLAMEPTKPICISVVWLNNVGSSLQLIPILVKTSAVNKLIRSSKKSIRVNISRSRLLFNVFIVTLSVCVFLMFWTIFDPPDREETRWLTPGDPTIVETDLRCASASPYWRAASFAWEVLLLVAAAVLAAQSRDVLKEFNESLSLTLMVYCSFFWMTLRGVLQVLTFGDHLPSALFSALMSYNYSSDALVSMLVYVFPKLEEARKNPDSYHQTKLKKNADRYASNERKDDYLRLLVCTANIGNAEPTQESMEAWIPLGGSCKGVPMLDGNLMKSGNFDIIAIGMQESTWAESTAKQQQKQLSEEDILNAMEEHHTALLREMLQDILGDGYSEIADDQRGQMRLYIYASSNMIDDITDVKISGANTGIGNVMANKGGIVMTLTYKTTRISFLSAHLAAHEGEAHYRARCDNLKTILRESKTFWSSKLDASISSHHMFVMGDLNFRTNFDGDGKHQENVNRANQLIALQDYEGLYEFDELQAGLKSGDLLLGFETLPCRFPPTFKVQRGPGFVYKEQRVPSYTDRILYKSGPGLKDHLMPVAYEPCVDFITSDHKPIRGAFRLVPNDVIGKLWEGVDVRFVFHKLECSSLPAADSNGYSDPYLLFLWDSVELEADKLSFKDKIRKMLFGRSWPRTSYIPKTLNPDWGNETIVLLGKNTIIGPEAMLFVAAMDADLLTLKDDFLGGTAINLQEATKMGRGQTVKMMEFDQDLVRGGKFAGRIKFQLDVATSMHRKRFSVRQSAL